MEKPDIKKRIEQILKLYDDNSSLGRDNFDSSKPNIIRREMVFLRGPQAENPVEEGKPFMLASTTKVFLVQLLGQILAEKDIDVRTPFIPFSASMLWELIWRDGFNWLNTNTRYTEAVSWLKLSDEEKKVLKDRAHPQHDELIKELKGESRIDWGAAEDFPNIEMNFADLCYQILSKSGNIALGVVRDYLVSELGSVEMMEQEIDIEGLELTISTHNLAHWLQNGANTGLLSPLAFGFHQMAIDADNNDRYKQEILSEISTGEDDYGFDFSNSPLGKKLKQQGYKIYEKTGYYPDVFWIKRLADDGYPPHMIMCTLIHLVNPEGERSTMGAYQAVEISLPSSSGDLDLPDTDVEGYEEYLDAVKARAAESFRNNLQIACNSSLLHQ